MASEVSSEEILRHLNALIGNRYPFSPQSNIVGAENYICAQLQNSGLEVKKHLFDYEGRSFANLTGRIAGLKNSCFIVGAHFDTVDHCPGAGAPDVIDSFDTVAPRAFDREGFGQVSPHAACRPRSQQ